MKPIGGTVNMSVDGERLLIRGAVTSNIGQEVMRTTQPGADQVHGFTEEIVVPFVQVDVTEVPEFPLSKLNSISDSTVTVELTDGRTLVLSHAAQVGELERNTSEGVVASVRFEGEKGQEMPA